MHRGDWRPNQCAILLVSTLSHGDRSKSHFLHPPILAILKGVFHNIMRLLRHTQWTSPHSHCPTQYNSMYWLSEVRGGDDDWPGSSWSIAINSRSDPGMIRLSSGHTKTDPFETGTTVFTGVLGLCPVRAVLNYLRVCPSINQGPLLILPDRSPPPRDVFVKHLKDTMAARELDHRQYSEHSFRIDAAAQAGVPEALRDVSDLHQNIPHRCVSLPS